MQSHKYPSEKWKTNLQVCGCPVMTAVQHLALTHLKTLLHRSQHQTFTSTQTQKKCPLRAIYQESAELLIPPSKKASFCQSWLEWEGMFSVYQRWSSRWPSSQTKRHKYRTRWHIQLCWWGGVQKSPRLLIDMTSSVISSQHLISVAWHVLVDRKQMVLRRLSYCIIMFMDLQWHKIWSRYLEKLGGVVGLPQTGTHSTDTALRQYLAS